MVALEALTVGLNKEVIEAVRQSGERRARLWSFEAKRLLNRSNVREAYFQAVSNSSWASFGYLVASEIAGAETLKEIQMLYSVHGIGLIELDTNSPTESIVRIPARERMTIEWSMCIRLADENKDFQNYIRRVRQFYQTGDLCKKADFPKIQRIGFPPTPLQGRGARLGGLPPSRSGEGFGGGGSARTPPLNCA